MKYQLGTNKDKQGHLVPKWLVRKCRLCWNINHMFRPSPFPVSSVYHSGWLAFYSSVLFTWAIGTVNRVPMPLIKKICTDVWNSVTHGVKISSPYVCLINVARSCPTWKRAFCWSVASLALQWWACWLWWLLRRSSPNGDWPSSKVGVGVASKLDGAWGSVLYLIVQYLAPWQATYNRAVQKPSLQSCH